MHSRIVATLRELANTHTTQKASPTPSQVHVPAPMGGTNDDEKKRRRRAATALRKAATTLCPSPLFYADQSRWTEQAAALRVAKGADPGTYIGRRVVNAAALHEWAQQAGAGALVLDDDLHLTVLYSSTSVEPTPDASQIIIPPSKFSWGTLGPDKAVVLFLESEVLQSRHTALVALGATETYASYQPHVTLFYLGAEYDSDEFNDGAYPPLPTVPLLLGAELVGPLGFDVFDGTV